MKMYDELGESELPDLPSGRFIADDHGPPMERMSVPQGRSMVCHGEDFRNCWCS